MKKNRFLLVRFSLSLIILFFFFTIVKAEDLNLLHQLSNVFSEISEKVKPSVVSVIPTTKIKIYQPSSSPFFDDPFFDEFRRFFGPDLFPRRDSPKEKEYEHSGLGSGVIITSDGYILTNNHVIAYADKVADKIKVILSDDREFDAEIIGRDPETDLAVIKINAKNLPIATLGNSDKVRVGEWVLAIGNPFGLKYTVTAGIISAVGRTDVGITRYEDFIQTDAAINQGNSGGPLVNLNGKVIGINTAIFSRSGGYMGVGFTIPINMAEKIMEQLIDKGKVTRGWLGVTIQNLTTELADILELKQTKGVVVRQVQVDSPADKADIKSNDIILKIDGQPIETTKQLMQIVAGLVPGTEVEITVLRGNKEISQKVKITEKQPLKSIEESKSSEESHDKLGLNVKELNNELAKQYNLTGEKAVVITKVFPDSLAERAELREGDLIVEIDGYKIKNMNDYRKAIEKVEKEKSIEVSCIRYYRGRHWRFTTRLQIK